MLVEESRFEQLKTRPIIFEEVSRLTDGRVDKRRIREAVLCAAPYSAIWENLSQRWQSRWQNWTALTVAILILDHNGRLYDRSIGSKIDIEALDTERRFIPFQEIWEGEPVGRVRAFRMKLFERCQVPYNSSAMAIRGVVKHTIEVLAFGAESLREVDNSKQRARSVSSLADDPHGRKRYFRDRKP